MTSNFRPGKKARHWGRERVVRTRMGTELERNGSSQMWAWGTSGGSPFKDIGNLEGG